MPSQAIFLLCYLGSRVHRNVNMSQDVHFISDEEHQRLLSCQEALGYSFLNEHLLLAALTHSSGAQTRLVSNERLEFLGDAILGVIIVDMLYHRCPDFMEGEMTQIKSAVVSRQACMRVSNKFDLGRFLLLGKGMGGWHKIPDSLLANMQESVIGAIYLDGGMVAAKEYVLRAFSDEINRTLDGDIGKNYKAILQQITQKKFHTFPVYKVQEERGPEHSKCFKVFASIGDKDYHCAWGRNKKEAEQRAARNALCELNGEPPIYPSD